MEQIYHKISIDDSTYKKIMQCKKEYLKHHPDHSKFNLSLNFITNEIANFYMKTE